MTRAQRSKLRRSDCWRTRTPTAVPSHPLRSPAGTGRRPGGVMAIGSSHRFPVNRFTRIWSPFGGRRQCRQILRRILVRRAQLVMIRMVLELNVRQPDVAVGSDRRRRIVLFVGRVGQSPRWRNAIGRGVAFERVVELAVRQVRQLEAERAARGLHRNLAVFILAGEPQNDSVRPHRRRLALHQVQERQHRRRRNLPRAVARNSSSLPNRQGSIFVILPRSMEAEPSHFLPSRSIRPSRHATPTSARTGMPESNSKPITNVVTYTVSPTAYTVICGR